MGEETLGVVGGNDAGDHVLFHRALADDRDIQAAMGDKCRGTRNRCCGGFKQVGALCHQLVLLGNPEALLFIDHKKVRGFPELPESREEGGGAHQDRVSILADVGLAGGGDCADRYLVAVGLAALGDELIGEGAFGVRMATRLPTIWAASAGTMNE